MKKTLESILIVLSSIFLVLSILRFVLGGLEFDLLGFSLSLPHLNILLSFAFIFMVSSRLLFGIEGARKSLMNLRKWCRVNESYLLAGLVSFALIYLLRIKLMQHFTFHTHASDLAIFDTAILNTVKGNFMFAEQLGKNFLSAHFSPILLIFYPLYLVYNSPVTLLVVQVLLGVGTIWFLYNLARRFTIEPVSALLLCLIFLNYKYYARGMMYDFHVEMMIPFFLIGAFWFVLEKKPVGYWIFIVLALMCKEDVAIYTFCLGLYYLLVGKNRRLGAVTAVVSAVWAIAVWKFILPALSPDNAQVTIYINRWSHLGNNYLEVFLAVVTSPLMIPKLLFSYVPLQMLGLLAGLPALAPEILLLAGPGLILNLTSNSSPQSTLHLYYAVPIVPFVFWAMIVGLKRLNRFCEKNRWLARSDGILWPIVVLMLLTVGTFGDYYYFFALDAHVAPRYTAVERVPEGAVVSAQSTFVPHLVRKAGTYRFPEERGVSFREAQYILLDYRLGTWPLKEDAFKNTVSDILKDTVQYKVIYQSDSLYLIYNKQYPGINPTP